MGLCGKKSMRNTWGRKAPFSLCLGSPSKQADDEHDLLHAQ